MISNFLKVAFIDSTCLCISVLPSIFINVFLDTSPGVGATGAAGFGFVGISILIASGVSLETMKQVDSQLTMRNYEGFLK